MKPNRVSQLSTLTFGFVLAPNFTWLARLGLTQDRQICISWFHHDEFRALYPNLQASSDELFIVDGDRRTCAGGTAAVHLAAHLVKQFCGEAAAEKALHSSEPVAEIALQSGFFNRSHFARSIRLEFDVTPSDLRAQHAAAQ